MESLLSAMIILLLISFSCFTSSEALTRNNGNITIKWVLMSWTPDGYVVSCGYSLQLPETTFNSVTWSMVGAQTTKQGECSMFIGNIPHSCVRKPTVVDLLPETSNNNHIAKCCKGGVLKPGLESAFQISVGNAGTSVKTALMPVNFMFKAPKQQYVCGPTKNVRPTTFISAGRMTRAIMTWNITCVFYMEA